jgi:AraC-like DNA-binding protein
MERSCARLWLWGCRALFVGRALGLTPHRNAVAVLCFGIDEQFGIARDPTRPARGYAFARAALIPPNTLHHLRCGSGRMAFLYLDPLSHDCAALMQRLSGGGRYLRLRRAQTTSAIAVLRSLADGVVSWQEARGRLLDTLSLGVGLASDARISAVMRRVRRDPAAPQRLADIAAEIELSPSRLTHLFKAVSGVPFKRFRLWSRLGSALLRVQRGQSLTSAALDAGFGSSAHFSATFREMFGIAPSQLARALAPGK